MISMKCRHIKSDGCKCKSFALRDKAYCYFHMQMHRAIHGQKDDGDAVVSMPIMDDRGAIQVALTQVLRALGSKRLDPRRAGKLLYGIQIAAKAVEHPIYVSPSQLVPSLTTDAAGEDMGPEEFHCDDEDDCSDCPYSDRCPRCIHDDDDNDDEDEDEDADEVEDEDDDDDENADEDDDKDETGADDSSDGSSDDDKGSRVTDH
jgi:hypothetical protein